MRLIKLGHVGPQVRDVQRRLDEVGMPTTPDAPGEFGPATLDAVRSFQQSRGLVADGIVGPDTWRCLIEAGWSLGDRLLYLARPMQRGDDVQQLQDKLNRLGFDAGDTDGIFGPDTQAAVVDFQLNAGLHADGTAGPETLEALQRLHRAHQETPVADVRARHRLGRRRHLTTLAGVPILLDPAHGPGDPGFTSPDGVAEHEVTWAVAQRIQGRLAAQGARPILSRGPTTTPTTRQRTSLANREDVDVVLSLHCNGVGGSELARGVSAAYFGSGTSVSVHGRDLAELLVQRIADTTGTPNCRAHPSSTTILQEPRAVAVQVELGFLTHPEEGRLLADSRHQTDLAACITDAITTFLLD